MRLERTKRFKKRYDNLPSSIQKQVDKQLGFLVTNFRHPSLKSSKMGGENIFEARVSKGYRMRYQITGGIITLLTVGQHDVGLGKK